MSFVQGDAKDESKMTLGMETSHHARKANKLPAM